MFMNSCVNYLGGYSSRAWNNNKYVNIWCSPNRGI